MEIATLVKLAAIAIVSTLTGAGTSAPMADDVMVSQNTSPQGNGNGGGKDAQTSGGGGSESNAQPANKIAAAGASIELMGVGATPGAATNQVVTLFDNWIKASSPSDLLIEVNAECALWTTVEVVDDDDSNTPEADVSHSESEARVKVWVTIDGVVVPVSSDDTSDPGKVVFCDRVHGMTLTENAGDEDNETISNYLRTRSANSFSWIALNLGDYPGDGLNHRIQVFAELDASVNEGEGFAKAAVGKRTLIAEPVMMANNASI